MVGRNETCPCGSGKKQKKCCGNLKVVNLFKMVDTDMVELQMDILAFAHTEYDEELSIILNEEFDYLEMEPEFEEVFAFHLINHAIFTLELDDGKTIIEHYIRKNSRKIKRPSLKNDLLKFADVLPSILRVTVIIAEREIEVEDTITGDIKTIKVIGEEETPELGCLIVGIVVPYGENYTFFTTFVEVPAEDTKIVDRAIDDFLDEEEITGEELVLDYFPDLLDIAIFETAANEIINNIQWGKEEYADVANLFRDKMASMNYPEDVINNAVAFWFVYCQKKSPAIRKIDTYAAAVHYLVSAIDSSVSGLNQTELAKIYNVSATSISSRYRELAFTINEELEDITNDEYKF
jgi:hypothetical protein